MRPTQNIILEIITLFHNSMKQRFKSKKNI